MTARGSATVAHWVEIAEARALVSVANPLIIANIPEHCTRTDLPVEADSAGRYLLPQVSTLGALRKMMQGDSLVLSARGMGTLVLEEFVSAAFAASPPFIVLADGTVITAQHVLALPDRQVELGGCQGRQSLDQWAESLAQIVTAAGPVHDQQPASGEWRDGRYAMMSLSPGEAGGARFQGEFSMSVFDTGLGSPIAPAPVEPSSAVAALRPGYVIDTIRDFPAGERLIVAGAGDDTLIFSSIGDRYDGGGGFDTLLFGDNVVGTIDLTSARGIGEHIENIDHLSLEGGNPVTVILDVSGVLDLEPDGSTLLISGSPGDVIDLVEQLGAPAGEGWTKVSDTSVDDTWTYATPSGGAPVVTLVVSDSVNVV